ncbi:hypothetical protein PRK78_001611 [Emydomyces testavorans]|uniref:Peptidase S8/S53 domain-containing protein n=1 Tax=Emydomyces testavorans TaxID=2070801 RepID=A0AAF0IIU8_9EURO|nr:hypothetical protein PRK78_001611 [Emydomyces testavorans]
MPLISINGNEIDPEQHGPVLRALDLESKDASKSNYILIQTAAPLSHEQEGQVEKMGVVIHEYVSHHTYLCGYKNTNLEQIRALDFVTWANVYLDVFVIQPSLKSAAPAAHALPLLPTVRQSSLLHKVDITFHHDVDTQAGNLKTAIATAARVDPDGLRIGTYKVRLTVQERYLEELAALDHVRLIQKVHPLQLFNNIAVKIIHGEVELNGTRYEGEGQVIAVGDTGFDKGSAQDVHHAFTGRVKKLYALGRPSSGNADDPNGHGTHVCGSVLGDGNSETMGGRIRGVAVKSSLVVQSVLDSYGDLGGIPDDLTDLFIQPYDGDGARIHTNSWGTRSIFEQLPYDAGSTEIDKFVWDHPDMVILFAAGNGGIDRNRDGVIDEKQIGSQAAAKNCITVGASENNRPNIPIKYGERWPAPPFGSDLMANHPEGMAAFSSRGPTKEGRIKPDVVAPGTAILSARSRKLVNADEQFGHSDDPNYWFAAGTSMATPLVAGAAAVLRESLVKTGASSPSAALIKALLINGAVELVGQYVPSEAGPSPNPSSGFGRVDVKNSLILKEDQFAGYHENSVQKTQSANDHLTSIMIPESKPGGASASGNVLKVTLVWSDPPGAILQNDLDLIVSASDGKERHGNMGEKPDFDRVNNVEQVVWPNIPAGEAIIKIQAYRIVSKNVSQPYALAWSINRPLK